MNHVHVVALLTTLTLLAAKQACAHEPLPPIRIGILHSLTGTMANSERPLVDALELAIEEINRQGGVLGRRLEPVTEDGQSDAATFARKAEKLIVEDKVVCLFGCWTSASRQAVLPVVKQHHRLLWYPLQYEGEESSPNIIYSGATPNQQITPAVDWCRREFGERMYLVGSDYVFPRAANAIIKVRLAAHGTEPVGEVYRLLGSREFADVAADIKQTKPDVILNTINGDSNQAFFQALRAAGLEASQTPVMSFSIAEHELRSIGLDQTVGHYASWNYFQSIDTPANRRFVKAFRQRYGARRVTNDPIESAYCQIHMFAKAARQAGSLETPALRKAARGLIYSAPSGLIRIDPRNQHTWKVARIGRIESDGQFKVLWSSEDPLPPQPYSPESFQATAKREGRSMFNSLSSMLALESDQPANEERRELLLSLANARGYLGNVRTKFQAAAVSIHSRHVEELEQAMRDLELPAKQLRQQQELFTEEQQELFEQFEVTHRGFRENAQAMLRALYHEHSAEEVSP